VRPGRLELPRGKPPQGPQPCQRRARSVRGSPDRPVESEIMDRLDDSKRCGCCHGVATNDASSASRHTAKTSATAAPPVREDAASVPRGAGLPTDAKARATLEGGGRSARSRGVPSPSQRYRARSRRRSLPSIARAWASLIERFRASVGAILGPPARWAENCSRRCLEERARWLRARDGGWGGGRA